MAPVWDPKESKDESVYHSRHVHSEGMISFAYRKPTEAILDAIRDTETYQRFNGDALEPDGHQPLAKQD